MNRVCIFDLDGTLIDSMAYFARGLLSILDEEGVPYGDEMVGIVTPRGYTKSAEYYIENLGVKDTVENLVHRMEQKLVPAYSHEIKLKPFVKEYLLKLKAEGAKLYVLTASPHIVTDVCLKNNGVFDLFDQVWSVEDFGLSKAGTALFYKVAETIGRETADIEFYDDNLTAVSNAVRAGHKVYGIKDQQSAEDLELVKKRCHVFVESFEQLL